MKAVVIFIICITLSCCSLGGCQIRRNSESRRMLTSAATTRAAYWWSTTLDIDSTKRAFMAEHHIERLYTRFFDVVLDDNGQAMPNATLRFNSVSADLKSAATGNLKSAAAGVEVVPVVFIVNDCMRKSTAGLAEKTFKRIIQMAETNGVNNIKEVQIDCDWTLGTRRTFYNFMREMRQMCHAKGLKLSATVRLHQLSQPVPPVDKGVLMVYNTGDPTDINCEKPILNIADAKHYLRYLPAYKLPLAAAYPVYSWRLLFRNGGFVGIMHSDDELPVLAGDTIVTRQPTLNDIADAQQALLSRREDLRSETIIFDLSNQNIKRFKPTEYETIFSR